MKVGEDGRAHVDYTPTVPGNYFVDVKIGGGSVKGCPRTGISYKSALSFF